MSAEQPEKKSPDQNDRNEIPRNAGSARKLERELDLGVKEVQNPAPGMPRAEGGGLESEIGTTPPEVDPDR